MEAGRADTRRDWLLPTSARPPLVGELERRIEEALVTARASEAAVVSVGSAALDAAEQARRAAELAERASAAALAAQERAEAAAVAPAGRLALAPPRVATMTAEVGADDTGLGDFSARADRLVARLRQLQRVPLPGPPASGSAARPQPAR